MPVEDSWYRNERDENGKRVKRVKTKRHGQGMRYRVRNPGAPTRSFPDGQKAAAEAWDIKVRAELAQGLVPFDHRAGQVTFREYCAKWMAEHHYTGRGRKTVQSRLDNHVLPVLGHRRMMDIKRHTITEWWAGMRAKRHHGRLYSASTLESVFVAVGAILRSALIEKVIPEHPMNGWDPKIPESDKAVRNIWEQDRVHAVLAGLTGDAHTVALVTASCGHRPQEAVAVAMEDLNRFRGEATVRHQVAYHDGRLALVPPKGGKTRVVPLPPTTLATLDEAAARGTLALPCVCHPGETWHILVHQRDKLIDDRTIDNGAWKPALVAAGVQPSPTTGRHMLRHVWVSQLIAGGATILEVSRWCGHKSITTTTKLYGHLFDSAWDRARQIMEDAYGAPVVPADLLRIDGREFELTPETVTALRAAGVLTAVAEPAGGYPAGSTGQGSAVRQIQPA